MQQSWKSHYVLMVRLCETLEFKPSNYFMKNNTSADKKVPTPRLKRYTHNGHCKVLIKSKNFKGLWRVVWIRTEDKWVNDRTTSSFLLPIRTNVGPFRYSTWKLKFQKSYFAFVTPFCLVFKAFRLLPFDLSRHALVFLRNCCVRLRILKL